MPSVKVDIYQAEDDLAGLVEEALAGKEIVITGAGRSVARLVPFQTPRKLGMLKGKLTIPDDFDEPLEDMFGPTG